MTEPAIDRVAELEERIQQLRTALVAHRVTTTAVGLLMGQHQVDREQAFALLVERSQRINTRLSTVALDLVAQAEADPPSRDRG